MTTMRTQVASPRDAAIPIVTLGIAGGTGAGKTTLTKKIYQLLGEENVAYVLHDSYYKDITHLPVNERAKTNFDHPDSLDTDLMIQHIQQLKRGVAVEVPRYDFATHGRTEEFVHVEPRKIVLVEGILIFSNPELVKEMDLKVYVDADRDVRFIRRLERDTVSRGRTVDDVIAQYNETVRPMHEEFVEPSKHVADLIVHSAGDPRSMEVIVRMITNHLRVEAGLMS